MKTNFLIILLIFNLIFNIYNVCFAKHNLSKPMKCNVDKRTEFMEKCINKIDFIDEPSGIDSLDVIKQCEETSQNLHCTY